MHFNGRFILNIAEFAAKQGADFDRLVALSNHDSESLAQADCRVGPEVYNRVLLAALDMTKDQWLGLHMGQHMHLSAAGLVLQIAQTSEDVLEAMNYCCHFSNLVCSAMPLSLHEFEKFYKVVMEPNPVWLSQSFICVEQTIYGHLIFSIREFRSLTHDRFLPQQVTLPFAPPDHKVLEQSLQCPVHCDAEEVAIYFHKHHFLEKIKTSDYKLLKILVEYAEARSRELDHSQKFYEKVLQSIVRLVQPTFPTVQQVAEHLNMSVRTFQRKLKKEGRSFQGLVDGLRKDFAVKYLANPGLSISEIAYLLDYADASTFVRSFKRWFGQTPGEYRQEYSK